jgi:electron transport complex protein RnfG
VSTAPQVQETPAPKSWRLITTLAVAGLLSGLAIVGIYEVTLPQITANKAERLRRAVFEVLPGAEQLQRLVWDGNTLVVAPEGDPAIYGGYGPDGSFIGYAIPSEGPGFQDNIKLIYGFIPTEQMIVGMQILESRETPGLGDKIFKDQEFVSQFRDLAVEPEVVLVKGGRKEKNQVDAITGATISSKAVVKILNGANGEWFSRLPGPGEEPEFQGEPTEEKADLQVPVRDRASLEDPHEEGGS